MTKKLLKKLLTKYFYIKDWKSLKLALKISK